MSADLVVSDLHVAYGGVTALRGVSLEVPAGGFVSVLGANGAGKTTLVRTVTGVLWLQKGRITGGEVTLGGESIVGKKSSHIVKAGVGQVPEGRMLFPRLSVEENLLCGAATVSDHDVIDRILERVYELFPPVKRLRRQTAGLLSGGEQQMVAVGRALMADPKLIVCDELSLGLAPMIVAQLFEMLTEINETEDVSVLVIEQNARLALQHTRHAYVFEIGEVVLEGPSAQMRDDPQVQELYLGGGGDAKDAYAGITRRGRANRV